MREDTAGGGTSTDEVEVVLPWRARCGEGPVWDAERGRVHWVDILAGQIHWTDLASRVTTTLTVPTLVGAVAPRRAGGYVAAVAEGFAAVGPDEPYELRAAVLPEGQRMNDAGCDPAGRFWAGSTDMDFAAGQGRLWMLDTDWSPQAVLDGLTLPNGMGWSPDGTVFYLADTREGVVYAFAFDLAAATLSDRRILTRFDPAGGTPDGLCVDTEGCLWVAMWGGSRVVRVSPDGAHLASIAMPVQQPSSCAFVGDGLRELWVTSAREGLALADTAPDGSILRSPAVGATGLPRACFGG